MKKHIHGGNIYQYQNCIDFSANCNPLGTPESVKQAIIGSLETISNYPQVGYGALKHAISAYESTDSRHIICGNGAADLIFLLCRAVNPKRALLLAPSFAEYEQALRSTGCEIEYYTLRDDQDFRPAEDILPRLTENCDILFLCNPNNPTGILTEKELLLSIAERCLKLGIFLVVDECFLDFVEEPEKFTLKTEINTYENLFLLKAFTKRYAMAGVRLGYGISCNRSLLERMELMTQPWNVSTLAQAAGLAALSETEYVEQGRQLIFREKKYLTSNMKRLGFNVYPSEANYLFFRGPDTLFEDCLEEHILIRDCSNYEGLKKGYFRIAVKQHAENEKLIQAFEHIMR